MPPINDYRPEPGATPEQQIRELQTIVAGWDRRLVLLAGANQDMSPSEISKAYAELTNTLQFAKDMQRLHIEIMDALKQSHEMHELGVLDLLKYLQKLKTERENSRKKVLAGLWAILLLILGGIVTAVASWMTGGGKHP